MVAEHHPWCCANRKTSFDSEYWEAATARLTVQLHLHRGSVAPPSRVQGGDHTHTQHNHNTSAARATLSGVLVRSSQVKMIALTGSRTYGFSSSHLDESHAAHLPLIVWKCYNFQRFRASRGDLECGLLTTSILRRTVRWCGRGRPGSIARDVHGSRFLWWIEVTEFCRREGSDGSYG